MRALIALLLLIPVASAATIISNWSFNGTGILPNGYVTPNTNLPVSMQFYVNEPYERIILDLSDFSQYAGVRQVDVSTCPQRICTLQTTVFVPSSPGVDHQDLAFSVADVSGDTQPGLNYRFPVDSSAPRFVSLGTPYCTPSGDTLCSLRPGANTIVAKFSEEGVGMNPQQTFLSTATGAAQAADSCTQDTCFFSVNVPASGTPEYAILAASADKAGNKVSSPGSQQFRIDSTPPVFLGIQTLDARSSPVHGVMTGPFDLQVSLFDESPTMLFATLRDTISGGNITVLNATCTQVLCTLRINPQPGNYTSIISLVLVDSAGNNVTNSTAVQVNSVTSIANGTVWSITPVISPATLDRATSAWFSKKFFVKLSPQSPDATLAYTTTDSACQIEGISATDQHSISLTETSSIIGENSANPVLVIDLAATQNSFTQADVHSLIFHCNVQFYSQKNGVLYEKPDAQNLSVSVQLIDNPTVPQKQDQIIADENKNIQQLMQTRQLFTNTIQLAQVYCEASGAARSASAIAYSAATALQASVVGAGASPVMQRTGDALTQTSNRLSESQIGAICPMITCEGSNFIPQSALSWWTMPGVPASVRDKIAQAGTGSTNAYQGFIKPEKSIVLAVATMCLPAIVQNLNTKLTIDCSYQQCLQTQVASGLPVSACQALKSDQECKYYAGAVFWTLPYAGVVQSIHDTVFSILKNPVALFGWTAAQICGIGQKANQPDGQADFQHNVLGGVAGLSCKLVYTFRDTSSQQRFLQRIASQVRASAASSQQASDACQAIASAQVYTPPITGQLCYGGKTCCIGSYCKIGNTYCERTPGNLGCNATDTRQVCQAQVMTGPLNCVKADQIPSAVRQQLDAGVTDTSGGVTNTEIVNAQRAVTSAQTDLTTSQGDAAKITNMHGLLTGATVQPVMLPTGTGGILVAYIPPASAMGNADSLYTTVTTDWSSGTRTRYLSQVQQIHDSLATDRNTFRTLTTAPADLVSAQTSLDDVNRQINVLRRDTNSGNVDLLNRLLDQRTALNNRITSDNSVIAATTGTSVTDLSKKISNETDILASMMQTAQNADARDRQKALQDAQKKAQEAIANYYFKEFAGTFRDFGARMQHAMQFGLQLNAMTSLFGLNNKGFMGRFAGNFINAEQATDAEQFVINKMCDDTAVQRSPNIIGVGKGGSTIGLYLQGSVTSHTRTENDAEATDNQYLVAGQINLDPGINATISIYLADYSGAKHVLVPNTEVDGGQGISWLGDNVQNYEGPERFTQVCIDFNGKDISTLFASAKFSGTQPVCMPLTLVPES